MGFNLLLEAFRRAGIEPHSAIVAEKWPSLQIVQSDRGESMTSLMVTGPPLDVELYVQEWKQTWDWSYNPSVTWVKPDGTKVMLVRLKKVD